MKKDVTTSPTPYILPEYEKSKRREKKPTFEEATMCTMNDGSDTTKFQVSESIDDPITDDTDFNQFNPSSRRYSV